MGYSKHQNKKLEVDRRSVRSVDLDDCTSVAMPLGYPKSSMEMHLVEFDVLVPRIRSIQNTSVLYQGKGFSFGKH